MKLLRLRLTNFRGVASREVRFAPVGVTIVAGPNEAGKTSLFEALDLLLDPRIRDDSNALPVRAVQPIGRDVPTEIELEAECGSYAFVYRKQFHKSRATELRLTRPRVERLTGREAHERLDALLRETCDLDLWRALRVQQGLGIERPSLGGSLSLAQALDAAAGGNASGAGEESLFARAQAACARHFTATGKPTGELASAERAEQLARTARDEAEAKLRSLDAEIERASRLDEAILSEQRGHAELVARADATRREAEAAKALRAERDRLAQTRDAAAAALRSAEDARRSRAALASEHAARGAERERCARQAAELEPALDAARRARREAEEGARAASTALAEATRARDTAQRDVERARAWAELQRLEAVRREIEAARVEDAAAADLLAKTRIDERRLAAIREAEHAVVGARARVETSAPAVALRALAAGELRVDGSTVALEAGEERRIPVAGALTLEVPGRLALRVEAGAGGTKLGDALAEAERELAARCGDAGVASAAEAEQAELARRDAVRRRAEFARRLAERLGGEGRSQRELEERIEALRRRLGEAASAAAADLDAAHIGSARPSAALRGGARPDAAQLDLAQVDVARPDVAERALAAAEATWQEADTTRRRAEEARESAREQAEALERDAMERASALGSARIELERAEAALAAARASAADDALDAALHAGAERARAAGTELAAAEARLGAEDATGADDRAEAAASSLRRAEARIADLRRERHVLQGRLEIESEQGLHGAVSDAAARHAHAARALGGVRRRAAAARRLFDTLSAARAEARRAYAAPLRERIERLGRYVFGSDLEIELDDELQVATRVLGGVPVPFASLSGGAREQLALLARIAAAELVARGEPGSTPLPLVLDDALGYTDAQRLAELGAVLAIAGRSLQVVILTCQPERWRHVGGALEVRL